MPTLYSLVDKTYWVYQPTFVRWRHRYRGPRESLKLNQEISQYMYDLNNIFSQINTNRANLATYATTIRDGGAISGVEALNDDATPSLVDVELWGLDEIESRIEGLRNRVRVLTAPEPEVEP